MPESTSLADRNATRVLADRPVMNRVLEAICTAKGLTYLDALNAYQNRLEQLGPQASVAAVLGTDSPKVIPLVKVLEQNLSTVQKTLDATVAPVPAGANIRRGAIGDVPEQVMVTQAEQRDLAAALANPEQRARRLATARQLAPLYTGEEGSEKFHRDDQAACEQGWDLVASLQHVAEVRRAQQIAKNEQGRLAAPIERAQAARTEERRLEQQVKVLDSAIADLEEQRPELRRRGLSEVQLTHKIGAALAQKHALTMRLEQVQRSGHLELDTLPALAVQHEAIERAAAVSDEIEKRQRQIRLAAAINRQRPEIPVGTALELIREGRIRRAED